VASFVVAGAPVPSWPVAFDVPSPQLRSTRWAKASKFDATAVRETLRASSTATMRAPAGTHAATSKCTSVRRIAGWPVRPTNKPMPRALLRLPVALS